MASQSLILLEVHRGPPRRGSRRGTRPRGERAGRSRSSRAPSVKLDLGPRKIALVEDHQDLLSAYQDIFGSMGWPMVFAGTKGEDLLNAVTGKAADPDIVIMDYRLPGMDGVDVTRRILRVIPKAKVVITTADDSIRGEAEAAGLLFLQKPFSIAELVEFLESA